MQITAPTADLESLPPLLTRAEAIALLRVSMRTLERLEATGQIKLVRFGLRATRVPRAEVLRLMASGAGGRCSSSPHDLARRRAHEPRGAAAYGGRMNRRDAWMMLGLEARASDWPAVRRWLRELKAGELRSVASSRRLSGRASSDKGAAVPQGDEEDHGAS